MNVYDRFWSFAITISSWSIGRIQWLVAKPRNNLRRTSMQTVSTLHWATEWRTLTWEQQSLHFLCTWIWVQRCWFCGMADSLSAIQRVRLWALVPWSLSNCTGKLGFAQVIFVFPRFVSAFFLFALFSFYSVYSTIFRWCCAPHFHPFSVHHCLKATIGIWWTMLSSLWATSSTTWFDPRVPQSECCPWSMHGQMWIQMREKSWSAMNAKDTWAILGSWQLQIDINQLCW